MKFPSSLFCSVFLLAFSFSGEAQDTVTAPKAPLRFPFIHKVAGFFKEKSYVIAPELGRKPETGVLGGLFYLQVFKLAPKSDSTTRKSNTESYIDYTEKKQILAQIKNNLIFPNDRFYLKGENFYNKFPDLFWGIGPRTTPEMQQSISYELFSVNQRLLTRINSRYFAGLAYQYVKLTDVSFAKGGILDTGHVSGAHGSRSSGVGFDLLYDSRDNILNTYKGLFVELTSLFNQKAFGGDHFFNSYVLDIRQFTNLGHRRILALQGLVNYNIGDVPFRQLALIGGDMIMRGYYYGRYRDKLMIAAQAEFRFPVYKIVGLTVFAAGAEVGPSFSAMNWTDLHYTVGVCLRVMINKTERLNMGIDSGIGQNTSGLYFNSGEAF
jgi:outer membrane protein assembly factor BamA